VHSVCSTAASVSDIHMLAELLHGDEKKGWSDACYQGQTDAIHAAAPHRQGCFRFCQSSLSRFEEEPRMAMRGLRAGQPLQESQAPGEVQPAVGPARGVVCPQEAVATSCGRNNPVHTLVLLRWSQIYDTSAHSPALFRGSLERLETFPISLRKERTPSAGNRDDGQH